MSSPIGNTPPQTPPLSPSHDPQENVVILSSEESSSDSESSTPSRSTLSHSARALLALESLRASLSTSSASNQEETPSTSREVTTQQQSSESPSLPASSKKTQLIFQIMQLREEGINQELISQACERLQISLHRQLNEGVPFSQEQLLYLRQVCQSVAQEQKEAISKRCREELAEKHLPLKKRKIAHAALQTPSLIQSPSLIPSVLLPPHPQAQQISEEFFDSIAYMTSLAKLPETTSGSCSHNICGILYNEDSCPSCLPLRNFLATQRINFGLIFQLRMLFQTINKTELLNAFRVLSFIPEALFSRKKSVLSDYELACILELCPSGSNLLLPNKTSPLSQLKIYKALASLLATQATDPLSQKIRSLWKEAKRPIPNPDNISNLFVINRKGDVEPFNKASLTPLLSSLHRIYYQKKQGVKGEIVLRKNIPSTLSYSNFITLTLTYTLSLMMDDPSCKDFFFTSTKGITCSSKIIARIIAMALNANPANTIKIFPCRASLSTTETLNLSEELREELFRELRNLIFQNNPRGIPGGWSLFTSKK